MPGGKDIPDWGGTYTNTFFQPLFDHGELAVRLGSPVTHDRRGAIVWMDTFEYGLNTWEEEYENGTGDAQLSNSSWHYPPFSARIITATGFVAVARLRKRLTLPGSDRLGMAILYSPETSDMTVDLICDFFVGGRRRYVTLTIDPFGDGDIIMTTLEGAKTLDSSFAMSTRVGVFNFIKIVVDLSDFSIPRVIINRNEYDTSAFHLRDEVSSENDHCRLGVELINLVAGTARSAFLDSAFLTAVEP